MSLFLFVVAQAAAVPPVELPAPVAAAAPVQIDWEVADRFRLFDRADGAARQRVAVALTQLARSTAPLDDEENYTLLFDTLGGVDAESLRRSNIVPPPASARYSNRYRADYLYPDHYWIIVTARGLADGAVCHWRLGDVAVPGDRCVGQEIAVPVSARADGKGASAVLSLAIGDGPAVAPETISITDELVVAMGDSYISGEGNPDVAAAFHPRHPRATGWGDGFRSTAWAGDIAADRATQVRDVAPARWWDGRCHRSLLSWPVLASFAHAARDPHRAVTLVHLGCSGDEVPDGMVNPRVKLPGGGREKDSQVKMLGALLARPGGVQRSVDTLFLSIGGNDIGFSSVVAGLVLPANGWKFDWARDLIVGMGGAACAYRAESPPLSNMCGKPGVIPAQGGNDRRSAEERFDELPNRLAALSQAFTSLGIAPGVVFQASYPNPLFDEDGELCRTALTPTDIAEQRAAEAQGEHFGISAAQEEAYAAAHRLRVNAGYEGLIAKIPALVRGVAAWRFQLQYYPDRSFGSQNLPRDLAAPLEPATAATAQCNWDADPSDSELCQGYWVWAKLNRTLRGNVPWTLVDSYQDKIRRHGWCNARDDAPLGLPVSDGHGGWKAPNGKPGDFRPYAFSLPRWFRTTNDSIMTQWVSSSSFHHGTIHPTYHAHLTIAAAMAQQAFGGR